MLANIISQTIIDEVIGNSEDSLPNKIKEKEESLQNTLNNRLSIPILKLAAVEDDEYTEQASVQVESNVKKDDSSVQKNDEVENNSNLFDLTYFSDDKVFEGTEKPINVKEHMIMNMSKKYSELLVTQEQEFESPLENEEIEDDYAESIATSELEQENVESEAVQYGMPANIEQILVNTVDFDTTVVAINQTREKYKNVAEQANRAEQDAEESAKLLEKISNEYTEAEKQLKEKELKSKAMEQKIISLLNNEQSRLTQQLQEKEDVINNAKRRKEENNDKIVDFKTKISSTLEKANEYDAMLSRQEELLSTLVEFNMGFETNNSQVQNIEKKASKVA